MSAMRFQWMFVSVPLAVAAALFSACANMEKGSDAGKPAGVEPPPHDEAEGRIEAKEGRVAAELVADPGEIASDGQARLRVVNRGEVELTYGRPVTVERWDGAKWVKTDESRETMWTMELLHVEPGAAGVEQPWPFLGERTPEPGWYRFTKQVSADGAGDDSVRLVVRARIRVRS